MVKSIKVLYFKMQLKIQIIKILENNMMNFTFVIIFHHKTILKWETI